MNHKVFYLDGKKINSKQTFLKQAAEAMEFPAYFGANWGAFGECNIQSFPIVGLNRL
jgi:RNAse (barnase) inhibitor barstar